jgi:hypothetical protein
MVGHDASDGGSTDGASEGSCGLGTSASPAATCSTWWARPSTGVLSFAAVDTTGDIFVADSFTGTITIDGTTLTAPVGGVYLAKFDSTCKLLWAKRLAPDVKTYEPNYITALIALPNGGVAASLNVGPSGLSYQAVRLIDSSGTEIRTVRFDLGNPRTMATDATGNIYIAGEFTNGFDLGLGPMNTSQNTYSPFVAKFDPTGTILFNKGYATNDTGRVDGLSIDGLGQVWFIGNFRGTLNLGGSTLTVTSVPDDASSAAPTAAFLARISTTDGSHISSKAFADVAMSRIEADACNGGATILGVTAAQIVDFGLGPLGTAEYRYFILHVDGGAAAVWNRAYAARNFGLNDMALDDTGNPTIVSRLDGWNGLSDGSVATIDVGGGDLTAVGNSDTVLFGLSANGSFRYARHWGVGPIIPYQGPRTLMGSISQGPTGEAITAGTIQNLNADASAASVNFGTGSVPAQDASPGFYNFVARFK